MRTREIILSFTAILTIAAGNVFGAYSGGDGTASDPYQIATNTDLLALAADTNDYGNCFILTADIDMQGQVFATAIIASNSVTGEDFLGTAFTGTFDGNGHKITDFTIKANGESNSYLGLFGQINSGGSVKNLGLENFTVSGGSNSWDVGGLAGCNYGGSISKCYSTGTISGDSDSDGVGGLAGENGGSISNCYATGQVTCPYDVGGMVGYNDYDGSISNCYSTGHVSGYAGVGGLVGWNDGGIVSSSFWDTQTSGQMTSDGGTGKTTAQLKTKSTFTDAGWNFFAIWDIVEVQTYPFFKNTGGGTPDDPYRIATKADLLMMAADASYYDKCFIVTADIDLGGQVFTRAIIAPDTNNSNYDFDGIAFTGTFDGNGHKIIGFTINGGSNSYLGLFGEIFGGSVKNLGLENFSVHGDDDIGGLAGHCSSGSISNCYSTGQVICSGSGGGLVGSSGELGISGSGSSVSNCYSTGAVSGGGNLGGLVGRSSNGSSMNNCYSTGAVSGFEDDVLGSLVGGLVGDNDEYGSISNCYSTGTVSGIGALGGLVGYNGDSIVSSFWDTQTSGQPVGVGYGDSNGATGKMTTQMKTLSTFTSAGWDFINVWAICEETNYPRLLWQIPAGDFACPYGVSMEDLNYFVRQWLEDNCTLSNNYCGGADMNASGSVEMKDFAMFAQNWL